MSQLVKFVVLFLILTFSRTISCGRAIPRIINGVKASDLAFIASVHVTLRNEEIRICVGSIVSEYFVLTSATCLHNLPEDNWSGYVRVGSFGLLSGGVQHNFIKTLKHPDYNFTTREADLLLLEVSQQFTFNEYVREAEIDFTQTRGGARVSVVGWGTYNPSEMNIPSEELMFVSDETLNTLECQTKLKNNANVVTLHFDDSICINGMPGGSLCNYDYGAPLIHENQVLAVWSWGPDNCKGDVPYVFTRIAPHINWISKWRNAVGKA